MDQESQEELLPPKQPTDYPGDVALRLTEATQDPLPHPRLLKGYEDAFPGAAERIVAMAEGEAAHRQRIEADSLELTAQAVERESSRSKLGLKMGAAVAVVFALVALAMVLEGSPWPAAFVLGGGIVGIVSTFVYGTRSGNNAPAP